MSFTDLFIRRPVLASVVSLLILVVGLRSLNSLEVRQFPETLDTVVTVTTIYPGASSELVQGFITTPLQQAIAEADGIDYIASQSRQGSSVISVHMKLNYDASAAVAEIQAKVASKRGELPEEAEDPVITSKTGEGIALMYIPFTSEVVPLGKIHDYVVRVAQPKLQAVDGVSSAAPMGKRTMAMRVWLDPARMAAHGLSGSEVTRVLRANNYLSGVGATRAKFVTIDLDITTDVSNVEDFENLVVGNHNGTLIRLRDIARIELGSESYDSVSWHSGTNAITIALETAPGANPLTVAAEVHRVMDQIKANLPQGMEAGIAYDGSQYIDAAIREVISGLGEALIIVLAVILLTLGSARAALIPAVSVPLSLVGGAFIMLAMGYSLNLLTLLSMVLAIGLVVDDSIVVVENIHRHLEAGESRLQAALKGARELGLPIIAMTTTLVAVYAPIGFLGGLVGTLFSEFAFSLAGAVLVSGIVALTLSPMLCSLVLRAGAESGPFERWVERRFEALAAAYERLLHWVLAFPSAMILFAALVLPSLYLMFLLSQHEMAPSEDYSLPIVLMTGPQTATFDYMATYGKEVLEVFDRHADVQDHSFFNIGFRGDTNAGFGGFKMVPVSERRITQNQLVARLQQELSAVAGLRIAVFPPPSLPGSGGGLPVQFVISTDADYAQLDQVADTMIGKAMKSGIFAFLQKSIEFNRPKMTLEVDRNRAGDLGISMEQLGRDLGAFLSEHESNRFSLAGRSYKVMPQVPDIDRETVESLKDYYLNTPSGGQVPLSALVDVRTQVEPSKRTQMQQLNSVTVEGLMIPGNTLGSALDYLEGLAREVFPRGYSWDYTGPSRLFKKQGGALMATFFMSLLVIYLVLAAQFESWRDPLIILMSVPLSLVSAMAFIMLGVASVNIYTQVGLITLIGLIAKNGILIVQFANEQQIKRGLDKRAAVEQAAAIRLRPILMTTLAMVMAMVPLLLATGPGAVSRFDIALVISVGLGLGTFFTLFVVPAFYLVLGRDHRVGTEEDAARAI